jgi:Ca-activated chloride channel family protein
MHWAYPDWIWLSVLAAGLVVLVDIGRLRKRRALQRLAEAHALKPLLLVSGRAQALKTGLLAVAAALLAVAAVGPQWGHVEAQTLPATGRDVLFVLDVSRSMLAEDVQPSRLERARADLRDLAASLRERGGYRVGLVAFADHASILCPLTFDYSAFDEELRSVSLDSLRLRGDVAGEQGTQIGTALRRVARTVNKDQAAYTDVVLYSDGEDMDADTLTATDILAELGVPVHAVGLGDPGQGALIPIKDAAGRGEYLKHQGELVHTRLEEEILREIAKRTGGEYVAERTGLVGPDRVLGAILAQQVTRELSMAGQTQVWAHRYQWFVLPAVVLLLIELMLSEGRRQAPSGIGRPSYFRWVRRRRQGLSSCASHDTQLASQKGMS